MAKNSNPVTAEQKIDFAIAKTTTPVVKINLEDAKIDPADVNPDLLAKYTAGGWRVVELKDGILTLGN